VIYLSPVVEGLVFCKPRLLVLELVWVYWHLRKLLFLAKEDWVGLRRRKFGLLYHWISHQAHIVKGHHSRNTLLLKLGGATNPVRRYLFFHFRSRLALFVKQLRTLKLYLSLIRRYAVLQPINQLLCVIIMYKLFNFLILHFSHYLNIIALLPNSWQLLLKKSHAVQLLYVTTVHMIEFFNEMYKRLRLHKALPKLFLVLWFSVLFEIKDMVSCCLVVGSLHVARFGEVVLLFAVFGILLVEIFKVIYQIK